MDRRAFLKRASLGALAAGSVPAVARTITSAFAIAGVRGDFVDYH
jgi:hypothetical protein